MRLAKYLKPYWWLAILAPLTMIGEVIIDLFQPRLMASIIDNGVLGGDMALIITTGVKMLLLVAAGGLCGILSGAFSISAAQSFANDLRQDLYKKVMSFSFEQTDKFTIGSLITRLTNDVTAVSDFISSMLRMFVRAPVFFIGGIVMMLSLNTRFALVMIVSMPIQLLVVILVFKRSGRSSRSCRKSSTASTARCARISPAPVSSNRWCVRIRRSTGSAPPTRIF